MALAQSDRTYTLLVQPSFTSSQAELVYQPLVDFLSEETGFRFELRTVRDFHRHWLDLRRGQRPDLVLEDAHLVALRMEQHDYIPLVRASEPTTFSLLTTDFAASATDDFVGRVVASMPAPSLGYLVLASWYSNPMQQPALQSSASSWLDAVEIVFAGEAEAAIVPHNLVRRYINLNSIASSPEFPYMTIAASPELAPEVRSAVTRALLVLDERPDHFAVLHELDIEAFVAADAEDYRGLERWLDKLFAAF